MTWSFAPAKSKSSISSIVSGIPGSRRATIRWIHAWSGWLIVIEISAAATTRACVPRSRRPSDTPIAVRMKENSPICARLAPSDSAERPDSPSSRRTATDAASLPSTIRPNSASTRPGCSTSTRGSNSSPTETKNSTAKASCNGNASCAARWLSSDSLTTAPATKAPRANDIPNSCEAIVPTPSAMARTVSVNSSREPSRATCASSHGTTRRPTTNINSRKATTLPSASRTGLPRPATDGRDRWGGGAGPAQLCGDGGQRHEDHAHREVLDHEPADGEAALRRIETVSRLEPLEHHDRARHGEREPQYHRATRREPPQSAERRSDRARDRELQQRARHDRRAHGHQIAQGEVQPDAEHEQDDAHFRRLRGDSVFGSERGIGRAHRDAGQQVAHDRRQADARDEDAEQERGSKRE